MKKIFLTLLVLTSLSCGKKNSINPLNPMGNCSSQIENYLSAITTYSSNPSAKNCQELIKSLDNLVNNCAILTAQQKKEYREERASISCD